MVPMPIDQPLAMLINKNQLLGQLIRILYEKAKRARTQQVWPSLFAHPHNNFWIAQNFAQAHILLTHAIDILSPLHHQDMAIGQLLKYLHYDRLLFDLNEATFRQTFLDHDNQLWDTCQSFLMENHSDNGKDLSEVGNVRRVFTALDGPRDIWMSFFRCEFGTHTCGSFLCFVTREIRPDSIIDTERSSHSSVFWSS